MQEKLYLCLDIGSSGIKGKNLNTGKQFDIANCISSIPDSLDLTDYYTSTSPQNVEDNIDIVINKIMGAPIHLSLDNANSNAEVMQNRYITAELATQYTPARIVPVSSKPKTYQQTTFVNLLAAITTQMIKNNITATDVVLGLLLPPREYLDKELKQLFIDNIAGTFNIIVKSLNRTVTFTIAESDIILMSECSAALATFIFNLDGTKRDEALKYEDGLVLAIDGGRSTTDLALINEHSLVTGSYHTVPMGGEVVENLLVKALAEDLRLSRPTAKALENAIKTGYIKQGARKVDISKQLIKVKREFSNRFFTELDNYLRTQDISAEAIQALLFIGGLFMDSEHEGVPSTRKYVGDTYKQLSQYTDVLCIENPRYANLEGIERKVIAVTGFDPEYIAG